MNNAAGGGLSHLRLVQLFDGLFCATENTRLEAGWAEPVYLPATGAGPAVDAGSADGGSGARVCFRADYASSALHEIAHWCIAGAGRRQLRDYGYWYAPDGRSPPQQRAFERVEARPQALEWIFSQAAGVRFHLSVDNLAAGQGGNLPFAQAVVAAAHRYLCVGLPPRAERFYRRLLVEGVGVEAMPALFSLERLGY
ncbi:MAG: elongation factor P hydroxylase [Cellvibrionales bacterium]|nr:elongation factor P hydroxylase [Cellvibrionales bacterium]